MDGWRGGLRAEWAADPDVWEPRYGGFDRKRTLRQLDDLAAATGSTVDADAWHDTIEAVHLMFDRWDDPTLVPEATWGFMIPGRLSRADPRYDHEIAEILPALAADRWASQLILAGLPPFVVDRYGVDDQEGVAIFTPVLLDMVTDLSADRLTGALTTNITQAIEFGAAFGVETAGLAATLPSLSQFGQTVQVPGVVTTTGHAGTTCIVRDIAQALIDAGDVTPGAAPWGLIGCGSIGTAIAHGLATAHPDWPVLVVDQKPARAERVHDDLASLGVAAEVADVSTVLESCELVISAVTSPIDLDSLQLESFRTTAVIDDSQPNCFSAPQLADRGASLYWPIGRDDSAGGRATRVGADGRQPYLYGAGDAGMPSASHIFGCEAEAAAIHAAEAPHLALSRPVRPSDVHAMSEALDRLGLHGAHPDECRRGAPASLQAMSPPIVQ